jgi:hypothetical protein
MFFDRVCITSAGYDILGPALAGSSTSGSTPLTAIWGNVYTSNVDTSEWSNHDMNQASVNTSSKFNASTYTCSGVVVSSVCSKQIVDSDDNAIEASVITLSLNMTNSTYNGTAATLLVFGMANIGDTPQLLIIASSNNPDIVPNGQPYNAIVDLHIQLSDSATTDITATDGWYASAENLQKLNNRAVTKHSLNDPSIGDDQTILGIKTFSNNTRHSGNILTTANGSLDIGTSASRWRTVYATTFDGNSSTATKLSTARKIDGVNFDGSADIYHYCTCGTGSGTATKQISLGTVNQLSHGLTVTVRFKYGNTADSPKLQINTLSAADIYQRRVDSGSQSSDEELAGHNPALSWAPGETITFVYDGNSSNGGSGKWYIVGHQNKPYLLAVTSNTDRANSYPLVFRSWSSSTSLDNGYSVLYTDGSNAINYRPDCSTLSCKTFYGRATSTNIQSDSGILSNGSTYKFYNGTCMTAANTATKVVTCSGFEYQTGAVITVNFTYKNSVTSQVYLNVNNKGAKPVNQESTVPGDDINSAVSNWAAGAVITFKYDGTSWIPIDVIHKHRYGTCTTADDKPNKVATIENNSFVLIKGAEVFIKFDYYNSSTSEVTLNVNGTGAKPIKRNTGSAVSSTNGTSWENNETVHFIYDGSNWVIMNKMCAELVGVSTKNSNEDCPLVFISGIGGSKKLSKHIYTDTANSIYYNPSTNTLTCPTFHGTASKATADADNIDIRDYAYYISTTTYTGSYNVLTSSNGTYSTNGNISITYFNGIKSKNNTVRSISETAMRSTLIKTLAVKDSDYIKTVTGSSKRYYDVPIGTIRLICYTSTKAGKTQLTAGSVIRDSTFTSSSSNYVMPAILKTIFNNSSTVLSIDDSSINNNMYYKGDWCILHPAIVSYSGNMLVALAIRIA